MQGRGGAAGQSVGWERPPGGAEDGAAAAPAAALAEGAGAHKTSPRSRLYSFGEKLQVCGQKLSQQDDSTALG